MSESLSLLQYGLGAGAGSLVGFTLGLVGGGGSILAVPLIVYLVGVKDPHLAIGTSAFAVAANAFANLLNHARHGAVKWKIALLFAAAGVVGAALGSSLGKAVDGQKLLALFAVLMLVVGALMLRGRSAAGDPHVTLNAGNAPKLVGTGAATGMLSGFFGIGGGFLIVPSLMGSTGMPIYYAVGSSLVGVTAFGLTTAFNYALAGWVDWPLAAVFIGGGVLGGLAGARLAKLMSSRRRAAGQTDVQPQGPAEQRLRGPDLRGGPLYAVSERHSPESDQLGLRAAARNDGPQPFYPPMDMTTRPSIWPLCIRAKMSLMLSSGSIVLIDFTLPSAAKSSAS